VVEPADVPTPDATQALTNPTLSNQSWMKSQTKTKPMMQCSKRKKPEQQSRPVQVMPQVLTPPQALMPEPARTQRAPVGPSECRSP